MKRGVGRIVGHALLSGILLASQQQGAFAQAGSTGGVIGKQDKSVSGGEDAAAPRSSTKPLRRPVEGGASDRSSEGSVTGRWRWISDCTGGRWEGEFDLAETAGGQISGSFAGTSWHDVGTITGHINGTSLSFTRRSAITTQYWAGRLVSGRLKGTFSGNANCRWEASRR
jgi:hypothetical protein